MKDFNFLIDEQKQIKRDQDDFKNVIWIGILFFLFVGISSMHLYRWKQIRNIQTTIEAIKLQLSSEDIYLGLKEVEEEREEVATLERQLYRIEEIEKQLEKKDPQLFSLLHEISQKTPLGIVFYSFQLDPTMIRIQGLGDEEKAIATFKHQLEQIEKIETIYIPQIVKEEEGYGFSMNLRYKDVVEDEIE